MDICTYHNARRASAYKWFFNVFFLSVQIHAIRGRLNKQNIQNKQNKKF